MTTIAKEPGRSRSALPAHDTSTLQRALLVCGIVSTVLYAATDILGGTSYPGYSFTSQTISELAAVGAPSKPLVDPLFLLYPVLVLAFAVGVLRKTTNAKRELRVTSVLLITYALVALASAPFSMQQRGAGGLTTNAPHIIFMSLIVLLLLFTMGFGAYALGRRFRIYSLGTLIAVIVFGSLTASFAPRMAAGLTTPGVGIIERVAVYAPMLWIAVLASALLRHQRFRPANTNVAGFVAPGFEEVRAEFERNFAERGEIGAAVAAYWRGEKVVDLWGGRRTPEGRRAVERGHDGRRHVHHQGPRGDDAGGGERARLARLRRAGRALLARVRAERQGARSPCASSSATRPGWSCSTRS